MIEALIHGGLSSALGLILLIVGVLCLCGAAWRAWLRDFPAAIALLVVGVVLLVIAA